MMLRNNTRKGNNKLGKPHFPVRNAAGIPETLQRKTAHGIVFAELLFARMVFLDINGLILDALISNHFRAFLQVLQRL